eukprot:Pgem_evm1s10149
MLDKSQKKRGGVSKLTQHFNAIDQKENKDVKTNNNFYYYKNHTSGNNSNNTSINETNSSGSFEHLDPNSVFETELQECKSLQAAASFNKKQHNENMKRNLSPKSTNEKTIAFSSSSSSTTTSTSSTAVPHKKKYTPTKDKGSSTKIIGESYHTPSIIPTPTYVSNKNKSTASVTPSITPSVTPTKYPITPTKPSQPPTRTPTKAITPIKNNVLPQEKKTPVKKQKIDNSRSTPEKR